MTVHVHRLQVKVLLQQGDNAPKARDPGSTQGSRAALNAASLTTNGLLDVLDKRAVRNSRSFKEHNGRPKYCAGALVNIRKEKTATKAESSPGHQLIEAVRKSKPKQVQAMGKARQAT